MAPRWSRAADTEVDMQQARAFFYITAGLFLIALTYHLGARSANAQASAAQEMAVLSGTVADGGTIPLPHYADGTEALESECQWIVSTQVAWMEFNSYFDRCSTVGRVVRLYGCSGSSGTGDCGNLAEGRIGGRLASYMIIATRATGAVSAQRHSIGQLKRLYR